MANLSVQGLVDLYETTMAQADPRTDEYPFLGTPDKMLLMIAFYLMVVTVGPKCMAPFKPFELRKVIIVYNVAMVLLNSYISLAMFIGMTRVGYSISCDAMEKYQYNVHNTSEVEYTFVHVGWVFLMSKFIEYLDTVFFILRKKNKQITFLHVYHHSTMTIFTWLGVKFLPGGTNCIYPLLNSFIHAVMYTYYGLAAFGPHMQKYLWWKKYLTRMQISQFLIFLAQGILNAVNDCSFPKIFVYAVFFYSFTILLLFINYYVKAYRSPKAEPVTMHAHITEDNGTVIGNGHSEHGHSKHD